ncbi:MAG: glycosyltransferase family 1 protein [Bacteroidales bacterium]|nr:glycosyltransferase family 1 protein [Bacteroidales bacterium]
MTRVLFISQYLNRNGTEAFMMNVFRGIDHSQFQVDFLLYSWNETDYSREVEKMGGRIYRVPSRRQSPFKWYHSLNEFFKKHASEYQAIHFCGNSLTSIAPIWFAYRYHIPVRIVHAHSSSARGLHNRLLHCLKRKIAYQISTHHLACSKLAAQWFFGKEDSVIIRNGIDIERYSYDEKRRKQCRNMLSIGSDEVVIGHVGRFTSEKNHLFIIDVFSEFHKKHGQSKLMLVGIGELQEDMKRKVDEMNLADQVLFMGERSDVNLLMQGMDLFLMPSVFEGLPFVLVEAQAAGLPCLISDVISKDVCITDQIHYRSLKDSTDLWADTIDGIISNSVRHKTDEEMIQSEYSIKTSMDYIQSIYNQSIV